MGVILPVSAENEIAEPETRSITGPQAFYDEPLLFVNYSCVSGVRYCSGALCSAVDSIRIVQSVTLHSSSLLALLGLCKI